LQKLVVRIHPTNKPVSVLRIPNKQNAKFSDEIHQPKDWETFQITPLIQNPEVLIISIPHIASQIESHSIQVISNLFAKVVPRIISNGTAAV